MSPSRKTILPTLAPGARPARVAPALAGERGIAMIEALITIVILAFGILGLAGLQARMQAAEVESYQRSQALLLLDDMAFRLSANRAKAKDYVTANPVSGAVGTGDAEPADCSAKAVGSARDICEWSNALKGASEQVGGTATGAMIGGRGCVEEIVGANPPSYRVTVVWQGLAATTAPVFTCGQGAYGANDALRRAVVKTISIAALTPP